MINEQPNNPLHGITLLQIVTNCMRITAGRVWPKKSILTALKKTLVLNLA